MLTWVQERQRFEPAAHLVGLQCATGLAAGRLAGKNLLLATGDRTANGSTIGPLTHVWRVETFGGVREGVGARRLSRSGGGRGSESMAGVVVQHQRR